MTTIECDAMADIIAEAIKMAIAPMKKQIAELKADRDTDRAEIAELKARPVVKEFRGQWQPDVVYTRGDCVSAPLGTWIALTDSKGKKPGESASCWFLLTRNGRDGRDGKDLR